MSGVFFPGLELVPGLTEEIDHDGEPIFLRLAGDCPIVVTAPHAGSAATSPAGATVFGERRADPVSDRTPTLTNDGGTFTITIALLRTLCSLGAVPHAAVNLVDRRYMDLNRTWTGQAMWADAAGEYRPSDDSKTASEFPRVAEFVRFRDAYYQRFHDTVRALTASAHPDGWLFDVHGRGVTGGDLVLFSGYGHYARRDFAYDLPRALHERLAHHGFALVPSTADPALEVGDSVGAPTTNLISGGRYGARFFDPATDPVPFPGVADPTAPHRVHGIQFELARELRFDRPPEFHEQVGIALAYGIFECLLANQVLSRDPVLHAGIPADKAYALFG